MPTDAVLQQIKIECFFPADEATAEKARQLAASSDTGDRYEFSYG
jgi:hypothetical protein